MCVRRWQLTGVATTAMGGRVACMALFIGECRGIFGQAGGTCMWAHSELCIGCMCALQQAGRARLVASSVSNQLQRAADMEGAARAGTLSPCACSSDMAGGPHTMRQPLEHRRCTRQAAVALSAAGALSVSSSAQASRQWQACADAAVLGNTVVAGSVAVGAMGGRWE
jgi:hypothetical protein